jgi:hypothetical protein
MKTRISALVLLIAIGSTAQAKDDGSLASSAYNSYTSLQRFQSMQMNHVQGLLDEINVRQIELSKTPAYTARSGQLHDEINNLSFRANEAAGSFSDGIFKNVKMKAGEVDQQINVRRGHYLQALKNLSVMDEKTVESMKLSPQLKQDLTVMRTLKGLEPNEIEARFKQYEGREFGKNISSKEDLAGAKRSANVKFNALGVEREVKIEEGQSLRLQTPSGATVKGTVVGVFPDGRVILQHQWPEGMKDLEHLPKGQIVNLKQASTVLINSSTASPGIQGFEFKVRYAYREIAQAIRSGKLAELGGRLSQAGRLNPQKVVPTVIDKTATGIR